MLERIMHRFRSFISELASVDPGERACNQYSRTMGDLRGNAVRRRNLRLYFEQMSERSPRMLLIGEAVSYRGGRLTGIPFVSEAVLLGGVETASGVVLGARDGFRKATAGPRVWTEASATMVWETIRTIVPLPLLWNAFPFHPFAGEDPLTNRLPSSAELAIGRSFIARLLRLFPIEQTVAVGNAAASSLQRLGVPHVQVRHPSQGGKRKFVEGMARLSQT